MFSDHLRLVASLIALGIAAFALGQKAPLAARESPCPLYSYGATQTCFSASQLPLAEGRLPGRPVDPSRAVYTVARIKLTSVIVRQQSLHPSNAVGIVYVFGRIPAGGGGSIPLPTPTYPKFVVVTESATARRSGPWRVDRTIGHLANGKPRYDPWNFYANNLDVVGNLSRQQIGHIGLDIVATASAAPLLRVSDRSLVPRSPGHALPASTSGDRGMQGN